MLKKLLITVLCCFLSFVSAQKSSDPTKEDVSLAKEFQTKFKDEKVLILSKKYDVKFVKDNRNESANVIVEESTTYFNISSSVKLQHGIVYDAESQVQSFILKNRKGKVIYNRVIDEYLSSEDLFHTDYRVKYVELGLPLLGYKKTVKTTKFYKDVKYFTNTYFSDDYRVINGEIKIHNPSWLGYDIKEFNFENNDITKSITQDKKDEIITYTYKNVAPISQDKNAPGPSFLYPHIIYLAKSISSKGKEKNLFSSVDDLYGWYHSLVKDVSVDEEPYKDIVASLIENKTSDEEKMSAIYYWVQDNIRYVAFEDGIAGFKPDSPQNVFKKRYGDCKGMAILTKAMLGVAGFDARLTWIGTDRLAYDYTTPSLSVDNHMICAVKTGEDYIFLDSTEKFAVLGDNATRIQNKQAMIENGDAFLIKEVPSNNETSNYEQTQYSLSIDDEVIRGSVIKSFEGESRVSFQNSFNNLEKGDQNKVLSKYLSAGNENYISENIDSFDARSREETLIINYDIALENAVSSFDNTLYIDLDPFKYAANYVIEDREVPLKLPLLEKQIVSINLKIPDGYKIETLPTSYDVSNELIEINLSYEEKDRVIVFKKLINPRKRVVELADFDAWNTSFNGLKEANNEQLVLTKK